MCVCDFCQRSEEVVPELQCYMLELSMFIMEKAGQLLDKPDCKLYVCLCGSVCTFNNI